MKNPSLAIVSKLRVVSNFCCKLICLCKQIFSKIDLSEKQLLLIY